MLAIIVILLVAYIIIPEIDLLANERAIFFAKLIVYSLAFFFVVWQVFFVHAG